MSAAQPSRPPFSPPRPHIADAIAAVTGVSRETAARHLAAGGSARGALIAWTIGDETVSLVSDSREAWDTMAARGLVPPDAVDDPRRGFDDEHWYGSEDDCEWYRFVTTYPTTKPADRFVVTGMSRYVRRGAQHPVSTAACVALAADWNNVLAAEALARELVARLVPWGGFRPERVVWRASDAATVTNAHREYRSINANNFAIANAATAVGRVTDRGYEFDEYPETAAANGQAYFYDLFDKLEWDKAVARGARVARHGRNGVPIRELPVDIIGRHYADLPNPFDPLVGLWQTGYALASIDADSIVLLCPEAP